MHTRSQHSATARPAARSQVKGGQAGGQLAGSWYSAPNMHACVSGSRYVITICTPTPGEATLLLVDTAADEMLLMHTAAEYAGIQTCRGHMTRSMLLTKPHQSST
jgi:hypothetical protein